MWDGEMGEGVVEGEEGMGGEGMGKSYSISKTQATDDRLRYGKQGRSAALYCTMVDIDIRFLSMQWLTEVSFWTPIMLCHSHDYD